MRRTAAIVCFCLALWATPAWANDITLTAGKGSSTGTINVSGTVTADSGWFAGALSVSVWQDGCLITTGFVNLTSSGLGQWTYNGDVGLGSLTSGATYNVTGDVTFTNLCQCPQPIRTQPTTSVAK